MSIAVATGVWLTPGELKAATDSRRPDLFSAAALSGAVTHASAHGEAERASMIEPAQQVVSSLLDEARVTRVTLHERDIDGCTLCVELDCGTATWDELSLAVDALVAWAEADAALRLAEHRTTLAARPVDPRPSSLWAHTVLVCHDVHSPDQTCDAARARELLPTDFTPVHVGRGSVYLGWHASLACMASDEDRRTVVSLVDELHGWWTSTWLLDQELLALTMATSAKVGVVSARELADIPETLARVTSEIGTVWARIDSFRLSLGGVEWPIWDGACQRWELADNLNAISRKRELLLDMHTAFREASQARRAARLNQIAGFFALMSSVASFVAVFVFIYPDLSASGEHTALRVVLASVALALTLAGLLWSSRQVVKSARRSDG